jgi:hypothetical protein
MAGADLQSAACSFGWWLVLIYNQQPVHLAGADLF